MSCSKFNLTNTGSTITTFNYQRCEDALWVYQAELNPNESKNIWLLDDTYSTAFGQYIVVDNYGPFPFLTPTGTPNTTPTPTPTSTSVIQITPSNTATNTLTPTITPTPSPTPYRNFTLGVVYQSIDSISADFTLNLNFSLPASAPDFVGSGFHGPIEIGDQINLSLTGTGTYQLIITKNLDTLLSQYGLLPDVVNYISTDNFTENDSLNISMYYGADITPYGYDAGSYSLACTNFSSSPLTYYTTSSFNIIIYTNASLTNPAPNGWYSDGVFSYQVTGGSGLVTLVQSC